MMIINLSIIGLTIAVSDGCAVPCRSPIADCYLAGDCGCVIYTGTHSDYLTSINPSLRCEAPKEYWPCHKGEGAEICSVYYDGCNSCYCTKNAGWTTSHYKCTAAPCTNDEIKDPGCVECRDGYQLINGQCEPWCVGFDNCAATFDGCNKCECTKGDGCSEVGCPSGALEERYCAECKDGYYLEGTECVPCPQVTCADPCVDLKQEAGFVRPISKCGENEICKTTATVLDVSSQCPGCDLFKECVPKEDTQERPKGRP